MPVTHTISGVDIALWDILGQAAGQPVARWVEYLTPSAYIDDILARPFRLDAQGRLPIPTGPGLGIELDEERLQYFSHP